MDSSSTWRKQLAQCTKQWKLIAAHDQIWSAGRKAKERRSDFYHLDYLSKGRGEVVLAGKSYPTAAGSLFLTNPGEQRAFHAAKHDPMRVLTLQFQPNSEHLCLRFPNQIVNLALLKPEFRDEFERALRRCLLEMNAALPESGLVADALLALCLTLLLRYVRDLETLAPSEKVLSPCELAWEFLCLHYHQPMTLHDLAAVAGLHPQYFSHKFAREKGAPPMTALTRVRIEAACKLLGSTNLPISEIGLRVGFQDAYYFSRRFKETLGLSPKAYRQQQSNGFTDAGDR